MTTRRTITVITILIAGATTFNMAGCTGEEVVGGILGIAAATCETDSRCNDGLFCNGEEFCDTDGLCSDGIRPCDASACDEEANTCSTACTDEGCDDGAFCNGEERCVTSDDGSTSSCAGGESPCFSDEVCLEDEDRCAVCTTDSHCPDGQVCVDEFCIEGTAEPEAFTVFFFNEDSQTTHILTASESFGSTNRLTAGASRTVEAPPSVVGDVFTYRAGRSGSVFATVDCEYFPDPLNDAVVTWTGFALECSGNLTAR